MRVLVCDDNFDRGADTLRELQRSGVPHRAVPAFGRDLADAIDQLFRYADKALKGGPKRPALTLNPKAFGSSRIDIAILDNNLAELDVSGARHTAETLAGYIRAFTNIPYIVSLNKNPQVDFDLRHLMGDYRTHADLALNTEHLSNRSLWLATVPRRASHFCPWYWPRLVDEPNRRNRQVAFVRAHIDRPVLEALRFPQEQVDYLTPHARGALSAEANPLALGSVTFREFFVSSCLSLPIRLERQRLADRLDSSDLRERRASLAVIARVVAAEIDRWLRRYLVGPQDVLVDVPHLIARMPFLLGDGSTRRDSWNRSVQERASPFGMSGALYRAHVARTRFPLAQWTPSTCFWWQMLKSNSKLNDMFYQQESHWPNLVFCEDVSRFLSAISSASRPEPREFAADFDGTWDRRFVAMVADMQYSPKTRFAV